MSSYQLIQSANAHIDIDVLARVLSDEPTLFQKHMNGPICLEPLGELKNSSDSTTKAIVLTRTRQPIAVIVCSRPAAPELIARGTALAESVRTRVGALLGDAIIQPIGSGHIQGRSYVVLPYCPNFSTYKPVRLAQRLLVRRPLLDWLQRATATAVQASRAEGDSAHSFVAVLEHLERQNLFDSGMQIAIRRSIKRIGSGQWQPKHTFDHNDLWLGNVMLAARSTSSRYPFVLIDWAGANANGYGIYDLMRIAPDLKLSGSAIRSELVGHSYSLQCELEDTRGHLLAALGYLHQHLENFPVQRYVVQATACWARLERSLASTMKDVGVH